MKRTLFLIVTLALFFASCNTSNKDIAQRIDRIEKGLLPAILIKNHAHTAYDINERMDHYNVPGVSIAFINKSKLEWAKGYGFTSAESDVPVTPETRFQAASISKPITAFAALRLVEEGKLALDDDINMFLNNWKISENDFTKEEKVTLRRLLSHSAGLSVSGFPGYNINDTIPDIIDILEGRMPANTAKVEPITVPGTEYRYSGGGYTVVQKAMTDVSGTAFKDLMTTYVLKPCGMKNSGFDQPPVEVEGLTYSSGHYAYGNMVEGKWHVYPEMAAAGLWTTPGDLLKYALEVCRSLKGESDKVLSGDMTREMLTEEINSHGLGPAVGGEGKYFHFAHNGANEGFRCIFYFYPRLEQGVAIMTNGDNGGELMKEIMRSFAKEYGWPDYKTETREIAELQHTDLQRLEGRYVLSVPGQELNIALTVSSNHLNGHQEWNNMDFEIYPETADSFFNISDGVNFKFASDAENNISEMVIHEGKQIYTFTRIYSGE